MLRGVGWLLHLTHKGKKECQIGCSNARVVAHCKHDPMRMHSSGECVCVSLFAADCRLLLLHVTLQPQHTTGVAARRAARAVARRDALAAAAAGLDGLKHMVLNALCRLLKFG